MAMAAAHVPPPPEFEDFNFSSQPYSSQQQKGIDPPPLSQLMTGSSTYSQGVLKFEPPRISQELVQRVPPRISQELVQRVPETPCWRRCPDRVPSSVEGRLDFSFDAGNGQERIDLRSVSEVPEQYHDVFKNFSHFNFVQSKVFDDVMYTDNSLVTSAPTGSGKTVIFELAIVRLLMQSSDDMATGKIIYVAPIKALCSERFEDWQAKFGPLGLRCCELTGDSQLDDYFELQNAQMVMTTPEKWDSMTRKWRDYKSLVQLVRLFLIDEVHQLNDETRGPTIEAVVSRMKTIQAAMEWEGQEEGVARNKLRFIAISATIPNISDIASWLSTEHSPALEFSIDESHRPVRLRRVVLGYPDASTEFKFDLSLNYRLGSVIQVYSDQKPTLVFCATRKGTQQAASVLVKEARFVMNTSHKQRLLQVANSLRDSKLRDLVLYGVGYHHAGMDVADRKAIESMFTVGDLPVLFATSTLAMGVNLPAHLVVIKSTMHYIAGMFQECSESQILQMIGRAGRPQFDTTATAVIMTRNSTKAKYEALLSGNQLIESSLHYNLIEHLNAEVVLHTITDVSIALEWLRSTFFYIRVKKNPKHYGMPVEYKEMEEKLQQLCLKNLQMLESCSLVKMNDGFILQHTELGRLMARYCVAFESMKRFLSFKGKETLADLVSEISQCKEFQDVRLRVNEKRVLNTLNKDRIKPTIRFQMAGKVKSTDMKVNCLLQATLGCLPVQEFALNQDTQKIFRAASRLSKCLMEVQITGEAYQSLFSAVILHKCIQARLWENSKFVSKQLEKIGLTLSTTLVNAGLTSFEKLRATSPREVELIMNRHPPFGNQIRDAVALLPHYRLSISQVLGVGASRCEVEVTVLLVNYDVLKEKGPTWGSAHTCMLLVGGADNVVLCKQRISDSQLLNGGQYTRKLVVQRAKAGDELKIHYISLNHVGVDIQELFTPKYSTTSFDHKPPKVVNQSVPVSSNSAIPRSTSSSTSEAGVHYKPCNHRCLNKAVCGHECCKHGIPVKSRALTKPPAPARTPTKQTLLPKSHRPADRMSSYVSQLHAKATNLPATPALNRIKPSLSVHNSTKGKGSLKDCFSYTPHPSMKHSGSRDYQSTRTVPPVVLDSQPQNSMDEEFWSVIGPDNGNTQHENKEAHFGLDEIREYEYLQQDDLFPDDDTVMHLEDSYDSRPLSTYQHSSKPSDAHLSTCSYKDGRPQGRAHVNSNTRASLGDSEGLMSEESEFRRYEQSMPLLYRGRKRIIDELLEVENENSMNTENVKSQRLSPKKVQKRFSYSDNTDSYNFTKPYPTASSAVKTCVPPHSRSCQGVGQGVCVPPAIAEEGVSMSEPPAVRNTPRDSIALGRMGRQVPTHAQTPIICNSGTVPIPRTCIPAPVTCIPAPVTCIPAPVTCIPAPVTCIPAPVTCIPAPVTCIPAPVTCIPAPVTSTTSPVTCSFFTAGLVNAEEDIENEGDVYGSIFAGIF